MKFRITLTWSKLMAFVILAMAFAIDMKNGNATAFMFAVPFATAIITGRQYFNRKIMEGQK